MEDRLTKEEAEAMANEVVKDDDGFKKRLLASMLQMDEDQRDQVYSFIDALQKANDAQTTRLVELFNRYNEDPTPEARDDFMAEADRLAAELE